VTPLVHRILASALVLAPTLARAADEHGGGEGHEGGSPLWHAINLLILIAVLVYVGRKPIQEFFAGRRHDIESNLKRSAAVLSEAEGRLGEWNRRMQRLDGEIEEIKTAARERAESERQRILADAHTAADRIRRDAGTAVEQETRRAREELRKEATQLALDLAGDLLRQRMNDQDRTRLVDEFIQQVEAPERPATRS
jgi:F-type H+-transporting ATPase subunit b